MNPAQRRRRRKRREEARLARQRERLQDCFDFEKATALTTLMESAFICQRGTLWKPSVQRFMLMVLPNCAEMSAKLRDGTYEPRKMRHITLMERGKLRRISPVNFRDRVVQRALCDVCLTPILENSLIIDNPASREGMGMSHARTRFDKHYEDHVRKYGHTGVLLQYDLSDFFHSIESARAYKKLNDQLLKIAGTSHLRRPAELLSREAKMYVMQEEGLGIGNHTSQLIAIWYASPIDHMFKEVLRVHGYGRYMDDGYAFFATREEALHALELLRAKCAELGLVLNEKKTTITPITKPIVFLKRVYRLQEDSTIRVRVFAGALRRYKRHYRGLVRKTSAGVLTPQTLYDSKQSYESVIATAVPRRGLKRQLRRWWRRIDEKVEISTDDSERSSVGVDLRVDTRLMFELLR